MTNQLLPEEITQKKSKFWAPFFIIPAEVAADKNLSSSEKMLFSAIHVLDNPNKGCFACNEYLGILVDLSPGSVSVGISKLMKKQFILSNGMTNERRVIWINPEYKVIHQSNCTDLENKIEDFYKRKNEKSAYLKTNRPHIGKPIPYNNNIKVKEGTSKKTEVPNNALQGRASSRGDRRDVNMNDPIPSTSSPTPKPPTTNSLLSKGSHEPVKVNTSPYVEYWNTLGNVTHHPYFNKDKPSKTYSTAHKLCSQLNRGMFNKNPINKTFLLKHKIDKSLLTKKFTKQEINKVLLNLSMMFLPGHWAGNGNGLKPNLSQLLYSPMNQSSMFLAMVANPDMADKTLQYKKPKDNNPHLTRKVAPFLDVKPKDNKQLFLLYKGIGSIVQYQKTMKVNRGGSGRSLDRWFDYYLDFLETCCDNVEVRPDMIRQPHWLWDRFLQEYEQEWYVDPRKEQMGYYG